MIRPLATMLALGLMCGAAGAQQVYRCGNTYSQTPCPTARVVETDDTRSAADLADAREIAAREKRYGKQLEQERLANEAALRPAVAAGFNGRPPAVEPVSHLAKKPKKKRHHGARSHDDEDFVAIDPASLKRKKTAR